MVLIFIQFLEYFVFLIIPAFMVKLLYNIIDYSKLFECLNFVVNQFHRSRNKSVLTFIIYLLIQNIISNNNITRKMLLR